MEREGVRGKVTVLTFVVVIMLLNVIINIPIARRARLGWRPVQPALGRDLQ